MQWEVSRGGQLFGPFTGTQMKQAATAGQLLMTDYVRSVGEAHWRVAGNVPGLFLPQRPPAAIPGIDAAIPVPIPTDAPTRTPRREAVGGKHYRAFVKRHRQRGEVILAVAYGYIGRIFGGEPVHYGELLVTDRRVVFYRKGWFGEVLESMPLSKITSIERKTFMGHRTVRIHTSHDDLEFKTNEADSYNRITGFLDELRGG